MGKSSKLTWERLAKTLPLLNVQELCRRAEVPRHRIANAQRSRAKLTEEELARIAEILRQLNSDAAASPRAKSSGRSSK